jgi:hypothetical protein
MGLATAGPEPAHCGAAWKSKIQNCTSCKLSMVSRNALRVKSVNVLEEPTHIVSPWRV